MALFDQRQFIPNTPIISPNKLPCEFRCALEVQLAESVVMEVKDCSNREARVSFESAVALNIASHAVDDMGHRDTRIGMVRVLAHDRFVIDASGLGQRIEALIPMDVPSQIHVHAVFDHKFFKGLADRKSTRLNSSHSGESRMPSSA